MFSFVEEISASLHISTSDTTKWPYIWRRRVLRVMKDLTKKQRTHFMHQVIVLPYNYMKKKKTTVYKVLNFHKLGHAYSFDKPWNDERNKPILNDSQIDECVRSFAANSAREKMTRGHVNELLVDTTVRIIRGIPILLGKRYNPTTLSNYAADFTLTSNIMSIIITSNPTTSN